MPLTVFQTDNGPVWINPAWDSSKPGTFAMVIGVSKYDYLTGDEQSYGLGQLDVSALTAYRFFEWLKDKYLHPDLPLAQVWLLLAPTSNEIQYLPVSQNTGFRHPSYANCEMAIAEWYTAMMALHSTIMEKSRALFFFSGHGLQVTQDRQILLPCDYLSPPLKNVNKALSTYNLYAGLGCTPVGERFFFVDACRNDHENLRQSSLIGTDVLNTCLAFKPAPIVYATGPGSAAWAPKDPKNGISFFGQALVECLECVSGIEAWYDDQHYWITFRQLEDYLENRVKKLLQAAGSPRVDQPIHFFTGVGKTPICEVPQPAPAGLAFEAALGGAEETILPLPLPEGWRTPADSGEWQNLHNIIQSEKITDLLWKARLFDLETRHWTDLNTPQAANSVVFREIARTDDGETYRLEVELRRPASQWFEVITWENQKAACVLIADRNLAGPDYSFLPHYTLRFDFIKDRQFINGLDVSLADSSPGILSEAARLWHRYRGSDIQKEGTPIEFQLLEGQLHEKCESALTATIAALLLIRAWRPDLLHDWLKNLANFFPDRPDGWVIWVEQLLRTKPAAGLEDAVTAFLALEQLPLPLTSEALGHAARQAEELLKFAFPPLEARTAAQQQRFEAIQKIQNRLNKALMFFRPGGFGAVFIGPPETITPDLILPG